jgi:hypothetical protein
MINLQVGSGNGGVVDFLGVRLLSHRRQGVPPSLLVDIVEMMGLGSSLGGRGRWRRLMMAPLVAMAWLIFELAWGMVGRWVFLGVKPFSHRHRGMPPPLLVGIVETIGLGSSLGG